MKQTAVIVTGANSGIGRGITRALAARGLSVIMACRNLEKSKPVLEEFRRLYPAAGLELMRLDLASLKSVEEFVKDVRDSGVGVSVLVNNAGVLSTSYRETEDGYEMTVGVNYLAQYYLTRLLQPAMVRGSGRIVNTSSVMYLFGRVNGKLFEKKKRYHGFQAYSDSKLAFMLFTLEMAERTRNEGITVNSVDPGIVNTNMIALGKWFDPLSDFLFRPFIRTEDKGAETGVFLATDPGVGQSTGRYYINKKERIIPPWVARHPRRQELWDQTEKLLGLSSGK